MCCVRDKILTTGSGRSRSWNNYEWGNKRVMACFKGFSWDLSVVTKRTA
jgi:hypothetical protein